jgi:hypothetical protein
LSFVFIFGSITSSAFAAETPNPNVIHANESGVEIKVLEERPGYELIEFTLPDGSVEYLETIYDIEKKESTARAYSEETDQNDIIEVKDGEVYLNNEKIIEEKITDEEQSDFAVLSTWRSVRTTESSRATKFSSINTGVSVLAGLAGFFVGIAPLPALALGLLTDIAGEIINRGLNNVWYRVVEYHHTSNYCAIMKRTSYFANSNFTGKIGGTVENRYERYNCW